jgi:twinkle protein
VKTFGDFGIDLGNRSGVEVKTTCPQCSPTRKKKNYPCLNVNTEKECWNCWHCGWSGTIKGGEWQKPEVRKVYSKPVYVAPAAPVDKLVAWFEKRGVTSAVLERNKVSLGTSYFPQVEEERGCIQFPYYRGDEVVNVKYRTHDKLFRMAAGAERILYGMNDIDPKTLIWVEGEIDKLSVEVGGYVSCVSVPDGAPAADTKNYSNKFDYLDDKILAEVELHVIAVDNDAPGVRLQEELVRRLGRHKCRVVAWPDGCKDANDVLIQHGATVLGECIFNARELPVEGTYRAEDLLEQLFNDYDHGVRRGESTSWVAMDDTYRVMPGEWTLVTGVPGHGKSEWLDALAINLAWHHGWSFAVYSPENQPLEEHIEKIAEKIVGKPFKAGRHERMTRQEASQAFEFITDHFTFMLPEYPTIEMLLETARELVVRRGVRGLIIDPWNEINPSREAGMSETDFISQALTKIRTFARVNQVHVWIVAHPTKLQKDRMTGIYPVPTPYDVSGSAHWRNKADNCIAVYRDVTDEGTPVQVHVQKIRKKANGRVGMVEFDYDRISGRYTPTRKSVLPNTYSSKLTREIA